MATYTEAMPDEAHDMHEPTSFLTKYIWSQDHKVIAIQYAITAMLIGLVALALSWVMRLQLGFPGVFEFIDPDFYYQAVTMHGMIMVIYLLTAIFLGGFGNYLIPELRQSENHTQPDLMPFLGEIKKSRTTIF